MTCPSATGSGSDYSVSIQHLAFPSTDIDLQRQYGVYHLALTTSTGSRNLPIPTFVYEQEMARVFGIEALHMSQADVLPYDYEFTVRNRSLHR